MADTTTSTAGNDQVEFTESELLESHPFTEPLVAGGVTCHGGFDDDGTYISPRTKKRVPAIEAWQARHTATFGTAILDAPLDTWPENYPNVAQAKFLLRNGVHDPIISTLTRIGTVEGFGAMIRHASIGDLQPHFDEDIRGTAMDHLDKGLYEAHARDEAGFEDEGGHKQMWFAARDVAFSQPVTEDETNTMLARMGIGGGGSGGGGGLIPEARLLPADVNVGLEMIIATMASLMLIEVQAFHVFAWAEEVLSDNDLVAGDGEAARLVSYIRADETPHVGYLRTVLSEMRDRTFVGEGGKKHKGAELIGAIWDNAMTNSLGVRREQGLRVTLSEVELAASKRSDAKDLLAEFHSLGSVDMSAFATPGTFSPSAVTAATGNGGTY